MISILHIRGERECLRVESLWFKMQVAGEDMRMVS